MKYSRLVVNGCSYMEVYALGKGHVDLAKDLSIGHAESLAVGGSANSRIIRTTVKDSYQTTEPTLYILGMTFIQRNELPILKISGPENDYINDLSFEGRWTNPQNQFLIKQWEHHWTEKETDRFVELMTKANVYSSLDQTEDLMYKFLTLIGDLNSRGHQIVIYNQADTILTTPLINNKILADAPKLELLKQVKNFIHGLTWAAVPWQHTQGVAMSKPGNVQNKYGEPPDALKHRMPGHHQKLNEYLINYIRDSKII